MPAAPSGYVIDFEEYSERAHHTAPRTSDYELFALLEQILFERNMLPLRLRRSNSGDARRSISRNFRRIPQTRVTRNKCNANIRRDERTERGRKREREHSDEPRRFPSICPILFLISVSFALSNILSNIRQFGLQCEVSEQAALHRDGACGKVRKKERFFSIGRGVSELADCAYK